MKSSFSLLTGLIILSQSILSVSAAVPSSPPTGGVDGGVFSQYFSNIKKSPSLIAGITLTDCNGSNYNDGIIVGFEVSITANLFQPKCKLISQMLSGIAPAQAGKALQGFTVGIPQYINIPTASSQWSGTAPGNIYYTGANVGIGTPAPTAKLTLSGGALGGVYALTPSYANWNAYGVGAGGAAIYNDPTGFKKLMIVGNNSAGGAREVGIWDNLNVAGNTSIVGNVGIGTTAPTQKLHVVGNVLATGFLYSSDKNLKKNITPLSDSLSKILSLNGYSYNWKSTGQKDIGIIAQEVEQIYPELVHTDDAGVKSVEYANLIAPLIEAIKEQQKEIDTLKSQVEILSQK